MRALDCRGRDDLTAAEAAAVAETVRAGGVVLYPTDTLYGLGADPFSIAGVSAIYRLKERSPDKPLLLLLDGTDRVPRFAAAAPAPWEGLMRRFWPGPLTLLFPARQGLPAGIRSAAGEVALRVPGSALCRSVLRAAGGCLTGTSANLAGEGGAGDPAEALRSLAGSPDLVVDAGTLPPSLESTILRIGYGGGLEMVREGAIGRRELAGAFPGDARAVDNPTSRVL